MFYHLLQYLLICSGLFFIGAGISTAIVAQVMYNIPFRNRFIEYEDEEEKEDNYEDKYYEEFEKLEDKEQTEEYIQELFNKTTTEETPNGIVILYYDYDNESFVYYSNKKTIPYLFLETVSMKYALDHDCKCVVVDMKRELADAKAKYEEEIEKEKLAHENGEIQEEDDSVFVKLKSYNKKNSDTDSKGKKFILRQKANRYSYRGTIQEYEDLKQKEKEEEEKKTNEKTNENMTFSSFKNMFLSKKNN